MKKGILLGVGFAALMVIILAIVLWPRPPRGEHETDRGVIYYFSDGVIAIDTSSTPHQYYIYANHPEDKVIQKAEIIDEGIQITGPGIADGAEEFMGAKMSVGYSSPRQPGKIRVFENHGSWSEGRQEIIDPKAILELVQRRAWDASVRELWPKVAP